MFKDTDEEIRELTDDDLGFDSDEEMLEGDKITIDEVLNREIILRATRVRDSEFYDGEYIIMQIEMDGNLHIVNSSGKVLIDQAEKLEDKLPIRCKITKRRGSTGRSYYTFAPVKPAKK